MSYIDFVGRIHTATERDYLARVTSDDKAACAEIANRFDRDYWDGERRYGYGGYRYDGRWRPIAEAMVEHYGLKDGMRVLDIGCGKAFLLYEFTQVLPGLEVAGIDISAYAIAHAKPEVRRFLTVGSCERLPWPDHRFDFAYSINTFHNLRNYALDSALAEMQRVAPRSKHITVEAYRSEAEKANLLYWQLTCRGFFTPAEWNYAFRRAGYEGDFGCIFFE